jgi:hypothetical protein
MSVWENGDGLGNGGKKFWGIPFSVEKWNQKGCITERQ